MQAHEPTEPHKAAMKVTQGTIVHLMHFFSLALHGTPERLILTAIGKHCVSTVMVSLESFPVKAFLFYLSVFAHFSLLSWYYFSYDKINKVKVVSSVERLQKFHLALR